MLPRISSVAEGWETGGKLINLVDLMLLIFGPRLQLSTLAARNLLRALSDADSPHSIPQSAPSLVIDRGDVLSL